MTVLTIVSIPRVPVHVCQDCHAGCCRSFAVPVTGADILRMEREIGLSFWDFACRWADPDGTIAREYAPHFRFEDEPGTPFVIALQHAASENFPETTKCRFLAEEPPSDELPLGRARCSVHASRPSTCRVFPTKFDETAELVVLQDVPPSGRVGDEAVYSLCPRPWTPADVDPLEAPANLVVAKYEMDFFRQVAELWNRRPRSWQLFPDFLRIAYGSRVVQRTPEEEPSSIPFRRAA